MSASLGSEDDRPRLGITERRIAIDSLSLGPASRTCNEEYSTVLIPLCLEGKNHRRPHDKQAKTHKPDVAHTRRQAAHPGMATGKQSYEKGGRVGHENDALPRDSKPTFFALQFTFL